MAAKHSEASDGAKAASVDGQRKVVWDDTNMRSIYANVSNVTAGREEIVLLFGMNQAWHASQTELKVQLTDRIILSPFVAKRLSVALSSVVAGYESKYGSLDVGPERPNALDDVMPRSKG